MTLRVLTSLTAGHDSVVWLIKTNSGAKSCDTHFFKPVWRIRNDWKRTSNLYPLIYTLYSLTETLFLYTLFRILPTALFHISSNIYPLPSNPNPLPSFLTHHPLSLISPYSPITIEPFLFTPHPLCKILGRLCWYIHTVHLHTVHLQCTVCRLYKTPSGLQLLVQVAKWKYGWPDGWRTVRNVLANFPLCDGWGYCKALCDVKFSQIERNYRKFSHIL